MNVQKIAGSRFVQDFAASPFAAICGVVAALLLKFIAARSRATAQKAAALLPLVGNSAPPHRFEGAKAHPTRAQAGVHE